MNHDGTDPWTPEEIDLLKRHEVVPAIKAYRERTGCGLLEGKKSADRLMGVFGDRVVVLPVVHLNGTGRDTLIEDRMEIANALRAVLSVMEKAGPNMRDYPSTADPYVSWPAAAAQYQRRLKVVSDLLGEIEYEMERLSEGGEA